MVKTILTCVMAGAIATSAEGLDSLSVPIDQLESHVRSTLLFGGSSPVSFAGEARLKIQEHYLSDYPMYMAKEQTYTAANYEGNESFLRLGMVVRPNRNTVLWSKIGFQHTLPGNFTNGQDQDPTHGNLDAVGYQQLQTRHDKTEVTANIHEDMSAGLALRTKLASFWVRMGNVIWTEASPLTLWKSQPRNFAWDYLPYEIEQPIGRYYEYNIAKGEKAGRAAWNKKALNGIQLESIQLPFGIYANAIWGAYERYDNFEREFVDFSNDLAYADQTTPVKGGGMGDSYRHLFHLRIAKENMGPGITAGFNLDWFHTSSDLLNNPIMRTNFQIISSLVRDPVTGGNVSIASQGKMFYKEPRVASLDMKGKINDNWSFHADLGGSIVDSNWVAFYRATDLSTLDSTGAPIPRAYQGRKDSVTKSDFGPAFFVTVKHEGSIPFRVDGAYISRDFYSPLSFAAPMDAFYPFGSNLVGAGKFIARGEGSPYAKNMAGLNLSWTPNPGYGHFRVTYGQHFQLHSARDLIFFPHRLNGQDEFGFFQSSYNRWGNNLLDHSLTLGKYKRRLGDESFKTREYQNPFGPDAGGLRSDYLSMYEGFVPFADTLAADSILAQGATPSLNTTIFTRSKWVPMHQKWTFNFEVDGGYDVGPLIGYNRVSGVERDFYFTQSHRLQSR
jgi:hypothetical protein